MSDCARFEERIVEALEGELDDRALTSHAEGCRTCQNTLRSYRLIQESYRGVPPTDVAPEIAGRILAAARERRPAARPSPARRRLLVAAAVLAAVLIPLFFLLRGGPRDPVTDLVQQGDAQREARELDRAEASYAQALALAGDGPRAAMVQYRLATLYLEVLEPERALVAADLLLARHPASDLRRLTLLLRAEVLETLGRREEALAAYRSLAGEFPEVASDITLKLHDLGDEPEELRSLQGLGYVGGD